MRHRWRYLVLLRYPTKRTLPLGEFVDPPTVHTTEQSELARQNHIVVIGPANIKLPRGELLKTLLAIESDRTMILRENPQQETPGARFRRSTYRILHQRGADTAAVKARQGIDPLQFDIAFDHAR